MIRYPILTTNETSKENNPGNISSLGKIKEFGPEFAQ
jgi:hypothetical protein